MTIGLRGQGLFHPTLPQIPAHIKPGETPARLTQGESRGNAMFNSKMHVVLGKVQG